MQGNGSVQAGWYPDPVGRAPYRWWDGTGWTASVADSAAQPSIDPLWTTTVPPLPPVPPRPGPMAPMAPMAATAGAGGGGRWFYGAGWVVLALVLCFPLGLVLVWTHPTWSRKAQWIATGALVALVAVSAAADASDEPAQKLTTAPVTTVPIQTVPERVLPTTSTSTTTTQPPTTTTTAAPTTTRPPTTTAPPTTAPPPPPTTAPPPPTTAVVPQGNCHPSYTPCVPITSDVDCAGGSGNGPAYTGRVEVHGYDEYDLDRDGDGIGCEDS